MPKRAELGSFIIPGIERLFLHDFDAFFSWIPY